MPWISYEYTKFLFYPPQIDQKQFENLKKYLEEFPEAKLPFPRTSFTKTHKWKLYLICFCIISISFVIKFDPGFDL